MNSFLLVGDVFSFIFWKNPRLDNLFLKLTDLYDKYCEALLHPKLHNVGSPADCVVLSYVTIPFSDEHKS